MALLFLSCLLILPVLLGLGHAIQHYCGCRFSKGIAAKIIMGMAGISLAWTIAAFFVPLNTYTEVPVIAAGLFFFIKEKIYKELYYVSKRDGALLLMMTLIILFSSSFYPFILDHFGYYVPTVQWLHNYGLVEGISNLDLILGQMSVWHIFQAGFSGIADPFLRINSVLLITYVLYIIENKSWAQLCLVPFFLFFTQSPSPDLPVLVISLIILHEILNGNRNTAVLFGLSVWVFAIKPTMIWLPILGFLYTIFIVKASFRKMAFGIFILILFFFKNMWTFGYPVFPIALGDFGISWKPDSEVLRLSSQYAVQKTYDMQYSYDAIQKLSLIESISHWLFLTGIKSAIHISFVITLIIFIIYMVIRKNRLLTCICIAVIIKCILVLTFSAQYRFFIDVFFVVFFVLCQPYISRKSALSICLSLSIASIGCLAFPSALQAWIPSFRPGSFMGNFERQQLYRPSIYHYHRFRSFKVGNLSFHVSEKYPFNFDTPLPAISESYIFEYARAGVFPQLKDQQNIRKGFIHQKLTPEQQRQVKQIMHTIEKSYQ
ncbi:hypothetical protein [uncultured Chryseobacterium sp.]|uniref:LIC_10190 family membrane protein n=1 Tax=uncultured Chryseobacterium sp. TaxID=259322 RepID=UPI0025E58FD3|nr:hypothetical protein [uncultured Chryseobacterium sp.]